MEWNDFYKSVKEGRFESVYLFTGPEELNKREALAALRRAILPAGLEQLNDATLENCSAQAIIDSAETMPVMCERRIVVVRDWGPLTSGKAKNEDADAERMTQWLRDVPESCIVVFYMTVEPDSRKSLVKALKKLDGYIEFDHLSGSMLAKWCNQQLKPYKKKMGADAVNELALMAGQDLTRLSGELTKLAAYVGDTPEIQPEDVRTLVTPSPEYSVFMILDHLLSGRLAEATKVANSVLQSEPVVRLINLIAGQLRVDAHLKYAMDSGSLPQVQQSLNITSWRMKHIRQQIQNIPAAALEERYHACVDANFQIMSGHLKDRAALDALMLKITMPANATKSSPSASKKQMNRRY